VGGRDWVRASRQEVRKAHQSTLLHGARANGRMATRGGLDYLLKLYLIVVDIGGEMRIGHVEPET
jgi:hypothetical protein